MNVLYLTMNPNRQSTTMPTEQWLRLLPKNGLRPTLVTRELGDFALWATEQGIPTYQNPLLNPSKKWPFGFLSAAWSLIRIVQKHGIDLIHCNEQNVYPIGNLVARWCKIPVVVSVHFTMHRDYCNWAFSGKRCPDRIFFTSDGNYAACLNGIDGIIPQSKQRVLYNGLDLETLHPCLERRNRFRQEHSIEDDQVCIGVACALRPRKQLEHLFEAAAQLSTKSVKILVAGAPVEGDQQYAKKLKLQGRDLLGDSLMMLGHVEDLRDFYNGLDVFVNTSLEEACSLSVIESLAHGCPVIGYPSKSVHTQILPDGGEIIEQDNLDQLIRCLNRWTSDFDKTNSVRPKVRKHAISRFDAKIRTDELMKEYVQILTE